ncbi:MAG: ATP synthase subunit I [Bradymonadia bacterium]
MTTSNPAAQADEMHDPLLHWVMTRGLVLGALVVGGFAVTGELSMIVGSALGVVLGVGNFWLMRRLMWRVLNRPGKGRATALVALLLKLAALGAIIFLSLHYLPVHPIALLAGVSVVVVMIMASAVFGPALPQGEFDQSQLDEVGFDDGGDSAAEDAVHHG